METVANTLFFIFAIIMPILIGSLHTYVHFKELGTDEVQSKLADQIPIMGSSTNLYQTWGLMSLMMGGSFIIIGLLSLTIFTMYQTQDNTMPPAPAIIAIIVYLGCSVYVGHTYHQAKQYYGGIVGIIGMITCLVITLI